MEKKKTLGLVLVGLGSALGLGWMLTRVIKPDDEEEKPQLSVTAYWD